MLPQQARQRDGGVNSPQALNRVLVDSSEVISDQAETSPITSGHSISRPRPQLAVLSPVDPRAVHVRSVLRKGAKGDMLRAGVIDVGLWDEAPVLVSDNGGVVIEFPQEKMKPLPPAPSITLILAVPRPKVLVRLLPQIASLGVRRIVLVNAYKVERCYFDSDVIRNEKIARDALLDGVMQAGVDAFVPSIMVEKRLKVFLEDKLPLVVSPTAVRILAEPDAHGKRIGDVVCEARFDGASGTNTSNSPREVVLAVGPEGGWMPREISMMEANFGFHRVTLGSRILRTDAAVIVLLGLVHDAISRDMSLA